MSEFTPDKPQSSTKSLQAMSLEELGELLMNDDPREFTDEFKRSYEARLSEYIEKHALGDRMRSIAERLATDGVPDSKRWMEFKTSVAHFKKTIKAEVKFGSSEIFERVFTPVFEMLKHRTDAFSRIFKTDKGSYYFGLSDGATARIRYSLDIVEPFKQMVFINQKSFNEIVAAKNDDLRNQERAHFEKTGERREIGTWGVPWKFITNRVLVDEGCAVGARPLEWNRTDRPDEFVTDRDGNRVSIKPLTDKETAFIHIGDPISEVIK